MKKVLPSLLATAGALLPLLLTPAALHAQWNISTVDSVGSVGIYTSLRLDSAGRPRLSYTDFGNGNLKYASYNGSSWTLSTVESAGDVGDYNSLALSGTGLPRISYRDQTNADLKYASYNGSSWTLSTVDSLGTVGWTTSLALDSAGNPWISYYDPTNGDLKVATTVPEPASAALLGLGALLFSATRRRSR